VIFLGRIKISGRSRTVHWDEVPRALEERNRKIEIYLDILEFVLALRGQKIMPAEKNNNKNKKSL